MSKNSHTKIYQGRLFLNAGSAVWLTASLLFCLVLLSGFHPVQELHPSAGKSIAAPPDTLPGIDHELKELLVKEVKMRQIKDSLISFAQNYEGRPYRYGAKGPKSFDCSGFVKFVYKHFNLDLNRTSSDQSNQGEEIPVELAQKGDLLFFTGSNKKTRKVGHVGIVVSEPHENLRFIHAASHGGIKISELDGYFQPRLLQARRLLQPEVVLSASRQKEAGY